jgi:hypothetical protein
MMERKHYEMLGRYVNASNLLKLNNEELGRDIVKAYERIQREAERDARERVNQQQSQNNN